MIEAAYASYEATPDEPPVYVPKEFVTRFMGRPRACACGHYADSGLTCAANPADPDGDEVAICADCAAKFLRLVPKVMPRWREIEFARAAAERAELALVTARVAPPISGHVDR